MSRSIVSVSLGLAAVFQFGGLDLRDPVRRAHLEHGDIVFSGETRRINLTFRRAS